MITSRQLRMALVFAQHRWRNIHPFEVQASVTNRCDYQCVFCDCPVSRKAEMGTRQWQEVIRQLGRHGTLRIKFQGGEPTLRSDFRELCAAAQQAGIIASVVTNGSRIAADPSLLDRLDEVVFSLDSMNPHVHDGLRGPGSHARLMLAMDHALARGRNLFVNMLSCRTTLAGMEDVLRFCEEQGMGFHAQPLYLDWKYANKTRKDLALTDAEIRAMHRRLAQWKRQGRNVMFCADTYERVANWPDHDEFTRKSAGPSSCMAGRCYIHIEPNGDVHPCGIHGADFEPRNLLAHGFGEAVHHARDHNCADCWMAYLNERKALFAFRPNALRAFFHRG